MYRDIRGMFVAVYLFVHCVDLIYCVRKNLNFFCLCSTGSKGSRANLHLNFPSVCDKIMFKNLDILSSNSIFALFGTSIEKYFMWK